MMDGEGQNASGAAQGAQGTPPATGGSEGQGASGAAQGGNPFDLLNKQDPPPGELPENVPKEYQFTLPEGLTITPELTKEFTDIAHEAKLTQAQADSLVKMHADLMMGFQRQAEEMKNQWAKECEKQGLTTPENIRAAKLAVDTFGGGKVMQALIESGVAYNPDVQRFLQNIGHLMSEDTAPDGKPSVPEKSAADLLFSNSKY